MKNIKKLLALVLALAICAAFALPALADDGETTTYSLTMNNPKDDHTYVIYQLLTGTVLPGESNIPTGTLGNIAVGSSGYNPDDDSEYGSLDALLNGKKDDAGEVTAKGLTKMNADDLNAFISSRLNATTNAIATPFESTPAKNDKGALVWSDLPGGYYIVVDTSDPNNGDSASAVMVQVVGPTVIDPKPNNPTIDKKIIEGEDKLNGNDYSVGDVVTFEVIATVPTDNLLAYANGKDGVYKMVITDTMSAGLTFKEFTKFVIPGLSDELIQLETPNKNDVVSVEENGTTTITITIDDLFQNIGKDKTKWPEVLCVNLTYTATLNEKAIVTPSEGTDKNNNKVNLEYSNNPTNGGTGKTEDVEVFVYTFKIDGKKVDGTDTTQTLAGAIFQLQDSEGTPISFARVTEGDVTKYIRYVEGAIDPAPATDAIVDRITTTDNGKVVFEGLDKGTYKLVELQAPAGYNNLQDPIVIVIDATIEEDGSLSESGVTYTVDNKANNGNVIEILNNKGSQLPSTGGMGTTILYIVGAVLVIGAGVVLFTKRRMSN